MSLTDMNPWLHCAMPFNKDIPLSWLAMQQFQIWDMVLVLGISGPTKSYGVLLVEYPDPAKIYIQALQKHSEYT